MKSRIELNKLLPESPAVAEVGCAEGLLSADICREWKPSKFYMIDFWATISNQTGDGASPTEWHNKNYAEAMERTKQYNPTVLRGISWEMASNIPDASLDLVYLDACHMYECVKNDLQAFWPKIKSGGILAGHDINNPAYGVLKAVEEFCYRTDINYTIIPENGLDASFYFYKP